MGNEPRPQQFAADLDVAGPDKAHELVTVLLELLATPEPAQPARPELASVRTGKDIQIAKIGSPVAALAALLINGGAATAILAYLSANTHGSAGLSSAASWSLMAYAIGIVWGAVSIYCVSRAWAEFGFYWEATVGRDEPAKQAFFVSAESWLLRHRTSLVASMIIFIGSSFWIAWALLRAIAAAA